MTDPLGFLAPNRRLIGWAAALFAFVGFRILAKIGPPKLVLEVEGAAGVQGVRQSIRHWGIQGPARASWNLLVDSLLLVPAYVVFLTILSVHLAHCYADGSAMKSAGFIVAWIVCFGGASDLLENGLVFALVHSVQVSWVNKHVWIFTTAQTVAKLATWVKFMALAVALVYLGVSVFAVSWV